MHPGLTTYQTLCTATFYPNSSHAHFGLLHCSSFNVAQIKKLYLTIGLMDMVFRKKFIDIVRFDTFDRETCFAVIF